MYKNVSQLLMYRDETGESLLSQMALLVQTYESGNFEKAELVRDFYGQIRRLLELATDYGFDGNLWQNYLTFYLMMNENPFSLTCERAKVQDGSVNQLIQHDLAIMRNLFHYDFSAIERVLELDLFSVMTNYQAVRKTEFRYNRNVSEKVQMLSAQLADASDEKQFFRILTDFYQKEGVGMFGLNKAFRIAKSAEGTLRFEPINNMDAVVLDDLVGYEAQKQKLIENTEAFVQGRKANNVLLFGDSGTGKSTSIKAIANQYYDRGLRMIEIYKHQFHDLSNVIAAIKTRNYKFILVMDDLSFEEHEIEYKYLKAVIEGGLETKPQNVVIYATSNRRHLIRETWNDRHDQKASDDKHHSDTVEEKMSLAQRFGVTINYSRPNPEEYAGIVKALAERAGVNMPEEELIREARRWELSHGGISGRAAQQFINYLEGRNETCAE